MTYLLKLFGQSSSLSPDEERFWLQSNPASMTGVRVDTDSALKISTAWACGRLLAESVAMLPIMVYRRLNDDAKERAKGHPLYNILHDQPNKRQTAFEFVDMLTMHTIFRGNGYAKILPGPRGPIDRLIPIHPKNVQVEELDEETVRYLVRDRDGIERFYNDDQIFHLRGLSFDGVTGVSLITYARESFGLTLAAERFGAKLFANYSRPGGFLKHPGHLSEDAQKRLVNQTEQMTGGENLHRLGVLEEGMEWQSVTLTPEDSQMLQTREFQAEDVCRWFRVPPHMVGLTSKSTSWGSGIEEMSRGFVTFVLMPWLIRWQQLISKDLILATETYFVEFITDALLRGDLTKRYNAYSIGRQGGWLASNEIRKSENMNPIDGGDDDYLTPLNMREGKADSQTAPTPEPAPAVHYQQILRESAARVVRKEAAAMQRAAKRAEDNRADWEKEVGAFYADHAQFVAQSLQIAEQKAATYCIEQMTGLLQGGPETINTWVDQRAVAHLTALAMEAK